METFLGRIHFALTQRTFLYGDQVFSLKMAVGFWLRPLLSWRLVLWARVWQFLLVGSQLACGLKVERTGVL